MDLVGSYILRLASRGLAAVLVCGRAEVTDRIPPPVANGNKEGTLCATLEKGVLALY